MTTQTTNFIKALNRIDPTQGLVEYVLATKPYHTKILDVLVEYVYAENINVTITEDLQWRLEFSRPDTELVYTCGYGFVWDSLEVSTDPDGMLSPLTILSATSSIAVPGVGYEDSNSFLVASPTYTSFEVAVASITNNQLIFSKNYAVSGIDFGTNTWEIVDGSNTLVGELSIGDVFYISSDTNAAGNKKFTVNSLPTHLAGITYVEVVETIPAQAIGDGIFHRLLVNEEMPVWMQGTAVVVSSSGTLPVPLIAGTQYYFQPTDIPGYFNLSTKRYPTKYEDYIDFTTLDVGTMLIRRDEVFVPGASIKVDNSHYTKNNGTYTVKSVVAEGPNERIFVYEAIPGTTPTGFLLNDGNIAFNVIGYDEPQYCPPSQMSDFHADTFIHERLTFRFEINLFDQIISAIDENDIRGYGETEWGDSLSGPYGIGVGPVPLITTTAMTSGLPGSPSPAISRQTAHMLLPTGIDTQMFDLGPMEERFEDIRIRNAQPNAEN